LVARINTVAFQGVEVRPVDVQVQIANGVVGFTIVGLPDKTVAESKERVRSALHALGLSLPAKRLTVNLAPADVAKEGSHYDLPIALGILAAMEVLPKEEMADYVVLGELSLDSSIRAVAGVLPAAVHAATNDNRLICPEACGGEAAWAGDSVEILAPRDLLQLINHIKGTQVLTRPQAKLGAAQMQGKSHPDLASVRGQETAKRALEITAAGSHNLLMLGPPGSGKSLLASCLPSILPPLSPREALEVSVIHSLAGTLPEGGLLHARPFRDPHHSASQVALIGGGIKAKPGEISLAHNGVLFLDELPEFPRPVLESLRQPLETGNALIARANHHVTYPARFQLIAAMNPCRCGYLGDPSQECTKAPKCGGEYQSRLSGPFLDRIDIQVDVPPVSIADIGAAYGNAEPSAAVALRVAAARDVQQNRIDDLIAAGEIPADAPRLNAQATGLVLEKIAPLTGDARTMLNSAAERLKVSARGYHRLLRVARTIADLDHHDGALEIKHIAEALTYRRLKVE
jgi:magnesium chelatase family protein